MDAHRPHQGKNRLSHLFHVDELHAGLRCDQYLSQKIGRLSRTKAQNVIRQGDLVCEGKRIKPSTRLFFGQELQVFFNAPDIEPSDLSGFQVGVLFEDEHILVIDKPPDLAVHPNARALYLTLTYWLKKTYKESRPKICHRIDRETSGIIVCAKDKKTEVDIKTRFENGLVQKQYLAIVQGRLSESRVINIPLALQGNRGLVHIRMIPDDEGKPSITEITPLFYDQDTNKTLVFCSPKTGRQHQIRAHLSEVGYPIVGDKLYSVAEEEFDAWTKGLRSVDCFGHHRHALHAHKIRFETSSRAYEITAPIPDDFHQIMQIPSRLFEDSVR